MSYNPISVLDNTLSPLYASPLPANFYTKDVLTDLRITDVILLIPGMRGDNLKMLYEQRQIQVLHLPIKDFTAPSQENLQSWIPSIVKMVNSPNRRILIHCQAGLGRTGTIVACVVANFFSMNGEDAIQYVRGKIRGAVETRQQELAIVTYANSLADEAACQSAVSMEEQVSDDASSNHETEDDSFSFFNYLCCSRARN